MQKTRHRRNAVDHAFVHAHIDDIGTVLRLLTRDRDLLRVERMMERLFFELTKTYPDGSMTFAFQVYKGLEPTSQYVRFERVTDTWACEWKPPPAPPAS